MRASRPSAYPTAAAGVEGIQTLHFDDGADQFLQLRATEVPNDPREVKPGYGLFEVKVNSQLYGGANCFLAAELGRNAFRLARCDSRFDDTQVAPPAGDGA